MINDPIVEEVRANRQEHAARFDYDIRRIVEDIRNTRKGLDWPVATPQKKRRIKSPPTSR